MTWPTAEGQRLPHQQVSVVVFNSNYKPVVTMQVPTVIFAQFERKKRLHCVILSQD